MISPAASAPLRKTTRSLVLAAVLAAALACRGGDPCVVRRPADLPPDVHPTVAEVARLLGDARRRLTTPDRELVARLRALEGALANPDAGARCRALAAARVAVASLPSRPGNAADRNALVLTLDLTAAAIEDATR